MVQVKPRVSYTGSMINSGSGERMRVEESIEARFVSPQFKKHLLLGEKELEYKIDNCKNDP